MSVPAHPARYVTVCVEGILYGVALSQFISCARLPCIKRVATSPSNWKVCIYGMGLLCAICTAHMAIAMSSLQTIHVAMSFEVAKLVLYTIASGLGDALLLSPLVRRRSRFTVVPVVLIACATICGVGFCASLPHCNATAHKWATAFTSFALSTKLSVAYATFSCTYLGLDDVINASARYTVPLLRFSLIDSGILHAVPLCALLALQIYGKHTHSAAGGLRDALVQVVLILPTLGVLYGTLEPVHISDTLSFKAGPSCPFCRPRSSSPESFIQNPSLQSSFAPANPVEDSRPSLTIVTRSLAPPPTAVVCLKQPCICCPTPHTSLNPSPKSSYGTQKLV